MGTDRPWRGDIAERLARHLDCLGAGGVEQGTLAGQEVHSQQG
jgi:hypothetical protein